MVNVHKIYLKHGLVATIDAEDLPLLNKYSGWYAAKSSTGKRWYVIGYDKSQYDPETYKQKSVKLHRIVMHTTDPKVEIDHIDHNGLNNCKSNLRKSTKSENQRNRSGIAKHKTSSRFVGVFRRDNKTFTSWRASLRRDGKWQCIGTFKSEEEAAVAYNNAAVKYFGEFATVNKIQPLL